MSDEADVDVDKAPPSTEVKELMIVGDARDELVEGLKKELVENIEDMTRSAEDVEDATVSRELVDDAVIGSLNDEDDPALKEVLTDADDPASKEVLSDEGTVDDAVEISIALVDIVAIRLDDQDDQGDEVLVSIALVGDSVEAVGLDDSDVCDEEGLTSVVLYMEDDTLADEE